MIAFIHQTCVFQVICTRNEGASEPANVFNKFTMTNSYDHPDCTELGGRKYTSTLFATHTCRTRMKESLIIYADEPSVAFQ